MFIGSKESAEKALNNFKEEIRKKDAVVMSYFTGAITMTVLMIIVVIL